jgi:hypothetical protein
MAETFQKMKALTTMWLQAFDLEHAVSQKISIGPVLNRLQHLTIDIYEHSVQLMLPPTENLQSLRLVFPIRKPLTYQLHLKEVAKLKTLILQAPDDPNGRPRMEIHDDQSLAREQLHITWV